MWPAKLSYMACHINKLCVYYKKLNSNLGGWGIPIIVIFTCVAQVPACSNGFGPVTKEKR